VTPEASGAKFPAGFFLADRQEFLVKSANLTRTIHEMNLKNPVTFLTLGVESPHAVRILAGCTEMPPFAV